MADQPAIIDGIKGLAGSVGPLSTILAFVVGLPSIVYTWNNQANDRARAFAAAVEVEEQRWNKLYDLYYSALSDRQAAGRGDVAEARFQALCRLASRRPADFSAFPLGTMTPRTDTPQHAAARDQVARMREGLITMLLNPATSSDRAVACMQQRQDAADAEITTARPRLAATGPGPAANPPVGGASPIDSTPPPPAPAKAVSAPPLQHEDLPPLVPTETLVERRIRKAPSPAPAPQEPETAPAPRMVMSQAPRYIASASPPPVAVQAQIATRAKVALDAPVAAHAPGAVLDPLTQPGSVTLSAGRANGWDIDVFWCEGARGADNLALADRAANHLAQMVEIRRQAGKAPATVTPIGRVRLRLLTIERQRDPGYRPQGLELRGEAREKAAADAVGSSLARAGLAFRYRPASQVTPWYLSAFVCQP